MDRGFDASPPGRQDDGPTLTATERVRLLIERDIESGVLPPGSPIDEKGLIARFQVSRTPVREALLMLIVQKLITVVPRSGTYVHRPPASELIALLEYLGEMEGVAARLAAQRMTTPQRQALAGLHDRSAALVEQGADLEYQDLNVELHGQIRRSTGNAVIVDEIQAVQRRLANYRRHVFDQPGRVRVSWQEHDRIVRAIVAGDSDAAALAMRDHIIGKGKAFADLILVNAGEPAGGEAPRT